MPASVGFVVRWIRVEPTEQVLRDEVYSDAARSAIQVTKNAFAVAERAKDGLVLFRALDPEQRHHVLHLHPFGGPEREDGRQTVGHLLVQQVTGVLRDEDQRG